MTTGIDEALVTWWKSTDSLATLVPDRVSVEVIQTNEEDQTGSDGDQYADPFVVFEVSSTPLWKTNSGRGWRSDVKVNCCHQNYDTSKQIAQAVVSAWSDQQWTGTTCQISLVRPSQDITVSQDQDTGQWTHIVTFEMNHSGV